MQLRSFIIILFILTQTAVGVADKLILIAARALCGIKLWKYCLLLHVVE